VLHPKIIAKLLKRAMVAPVEEHKASEILSERESEILKLVAMGMSNKEIAEKLFLSERTIKAHLTNIFNKLNVASRSEAIVKGLQWRLVTLENTEAKLQD
jgi:NarL family two-component system response regulator LiaR